MNLLIINPPGAKSKKEQFEICNYFRRNFKIKSYVTYLYDNKPESNKDYFISYDDWVKENSDYIEKYNINDLEKEFPNTNLWSIVVSQRTFYDYSYLDGLEPYFNPPLKDSIFVIKSIVLFYSRLIKEKKIKLKNLNAC